ncbi:MAG: protein translocase subunit SecDF [Chloroflexota bacterium]|nr:MAG: protein translocase subunit SecDF [Chloroflexota bacterium]
MKQRNITIVIGILLLTAVLIWINSVNLEYTYPEATEGAPAEAVPWWVALLPWQGSQQRSIAVHQGLDLQGGLQVVLEADLPAGQQLQEGAMEAARVIVDNRVNGLGVTEPLVQLQGSNRMIVELPGISDPELAISTLRETGLLEFVDAQSSPIPEGTIIQTSFGGAGQASPTQPVTGTNEISGTGEISASQVAPPAPIYPTIITGSDLDQVSNAGFNPDRRVVEINFSLKPEGGQKFGEYTGANIGNFLCIVLDKKVLSCPTVNARIDTSGTISLGQDSLEQGQALAIQLKYGALPVPLKVVENRTIGPTLGQDSVQRSIQAGTIGLVIVSLFMLIYYRLPGFMAVLALAVYGLLNFALYKTIPVTLTLPAITGFILSVGIAVDGNILVFERLKEELRAGRSLKTAMELAFNRAWPSIRDSALSTLITCLILFWFGSNFGAGVVKGFAITLALGELIHLFTNITVTRAFLRLMVGITGEGLKDRPFLLGYQREPASGPTPRWASWLLDIVGKRKWYYILSLVFIIPGLIGMIFSQIEYGTPLKLGIDFTSGSLMELQFEQPVQPAQVQQIFANFSYNGLDFKDTAVTTANQLGQETILIRSKFLEEEPKSLLQEELQSKLGNFKELRFDSVGPTIGREVGQAASYAIAAAAVAILLFLVFAFRSVPNAFRYGVAAVVAMLHDILVTAGLFAIAGLVLGWEVNALFLTAILTVIGYSVHDTIIVFDRLRENLPRHRNEPYEVVCNRSILETLNRSLVTSISTMFVVIAILLFGGATIRQFIAIILVGIISGTYSSIFNAVPILVSWQMGEIGNLFRRLTGRTPVEATAQS